MAPIELLREFEKQFSQLSIAERQLLEDRKTKFFLQAAHDELENKLFPLLANTGTSIGLSRD